MKNLLYLIVGLLLYFNAYAENWMSKADIAKQNARIQGTIGHKNRGDCGSDCSDTEGHDLNREKRADVSVDDLTKPIYRVPELSLELANCVDNADCLANNFVCSESDTVKKWDEKTNWPNIPGSTSLNDTDLWFLWCEKAIGFDQKLEEQWVFDPTMVASADANDAALNTKNTELLDAKTKLRQAIPIWDTITAAQLKAIVKHLVRRHLRE